MPLRAHLAAALLCFWAASTGVKAGSIADRTLTRPEGERHYIVIDPAQPGAGKRPAIILLHGHGASAAMITGIASFGGYKSLAWQRLAEREGVLLVAPDGVKASDGKRAWNDCRGDATTNATTDDTAFLGALVDVMIAELDVDPERIYVFGSSNGGGMALRLGVEMAPRLAAIAVQSALMPAHSSCGEPRRPMSVFFTHGSKDPITPYAGGEAGGMFLHGRGRVIDADASVALWRAAAQLPPTPVVHRFPHLHADDSTSATRMVWGADPAGVQVAFLRIEGGGHTPAATDEQLPWLLRMVVGDMNRDVDMAEEMWRFFKDKRATLKP